MRRYVEDMLDCCTPLSEVQKNGITFQQTACLAQCNGAEAKVLPYGSFSLDEFRQLVIELCGQADKFLIASYSRSTVRCRPLPALSPRRNPPAQS